MRKKIPKTAAAAQDQHGVEYAVWPLSRFKPHPKIVGQLPPLGPDERKRLAEIVLRSKPEEILLDALPSGELLDGYERLDIGKKKTRKRCGVRIHHDLVGRPFAQVAFALDVNLARRQMGDADRNKVALLRLDIEKELATERRSAGQTKGGKARAAKITGAKAPALPGNIAPEQTKGKAIDIAAKAAKVSSGTLYKLDKLTKDNAPAKKLLDEGIASRHAAFRLHALLRTKPEDEERIVGEILAAEGDQQKKLLRAVIKDLQGSASNAGQQVVSPPLEPPAPAPPPTSGTFTPPDQNETPVPPICNGALPSSWSVPNPLPWPTLVACFDDMLLAYIGTTDERSKMEKIAGYFEHRARGLRSHLLHASPARWEAHVNEAPHVASPP